MTVKGKRNVVEMLPICNFANLCHFATPWDSERQPLFYFFNFLYIRHQVVRYSATVGPHCTIVKRLRMIVQRCHWPLKPSTLNLHHCSLVSTSTSTDSWSGCSVRRVQDPIWLLRHADMTTQALGNPATLPREPPVLSLNKFWKFENFKSSLGPIWASLSMGLDWSADPSKGESQPLFGIFSFFKSAPRSGLFFSSFLSLSTDVINMTGKSTKNTI